MMKTKDLPAVTSTLIDKLKADGYSETVLKNTQWILGHFENYCGKHDIPEINAPVASEFVRECFGFDYYNTTAPMQTVMRRPLLILLEFEESGNYYKTHQRGSTTEIPLVYKDVFLEYRDVVNGLSLCQNSKERKLWIFVKYFEYLEKNNILSLAEIQFQTVHNYINSLNSYAPSTIRCIKSVLREIYDWLYSQKYIPFSGRQVFPMIRKDPRNKLLPYYSKEEVAQLLSCIDTDTASGKCIYAVISILVYLGMRAGDIIRLKFTDIDWNTGTIHFTQHKTGKPLSLPLLDEVKYPLLDYIKNGRHESADPDYVFVTLYAPYTKFSSTSSIFRMVEKCMQTAGINYEGRHHGPHSLRHSLATNMMSENVPVSAIAKILGHSSTKTTETYLTVDETHLKEISLEVPYV
ncbi:MAG: tyrosine-type recombinase/integrase [Lachnospiraceae bacterium]|nr:tyrosine-type recombinase/integrase [Lachnospiraceae bacterium]